MPKSPAPPLPTVPPLSNAACPPTALKSTTKRRPVKVLQGVRILSLALNLPGPAALMRCRAMGAICRKIEPPPPPGATSSDPMHHYCPPAYADLQTGVRVTTANLKTTAGQRSLHRLLRSTDVLLTSFRPSALQKLGLDWSALQAAYPDLNQVAVVGAPGDRANEPGHDLTYLAEHGLIDGLVLPPTLYADMAGSLLVVEAILQAVLSQQRTATRGGTYQEVALSDAAAYLALPRHWGLTAPGTGAAVGGGHAGYGIYRCRDGRVAVAALEPHFAAALCQAVGLTASRADGSLDASALLYLPRAHRTVAAFFKARTRDELRALAARADLPLHTLP